MATITFNTVPANAAASAVFVEQEAKRASLGGLVIPQRIALLGQYNTGKTPTDNQAVNVTSKAQADGLFGQGSMLSLMVEAALRGSRTVPIDAFPIPDEGGAVAASGKISVSVTTVTAGTLAVYIAGKRVAVAVSAGQSDSEIASAIVDAINAKADLPVTAQVNGTNNYEADLTCRWKGASGNGITIKTNLESSDAENAPGGVTLTITDMASGATDPSLATALAGFGDVWYTAVACPFNTDAALDELEAAGDARIAPDVKRPFAGIAGYVDSRTDLLTALESRNSQWTTLVPVEASPNLPLEIAAAVCGEIAAAAQTDPARPFRTLALDDIRPGAGANWTYAEKNQVVLAGGSVTYKDASDVVRIFDLATTRTKTDLGADEDFWRFTVTIFNVQAKIYSLDQLFLGSPFDRAVVVDDSAVTAKSYAVSPRRVKSYVIQLVDELWIANGWSRNRDDIVAGLAAEIDAGNPGRINVLVPDVVAAGLRIVAVKYEWSFTPASVAA